MMNDIHKAITYPKKAIRHIGNRIGYYHTKAILDMYKWYNSIESQKRLIDEFVENDEFILVILDACRYDIFKDVYGEYLTGELSKVWASGRWTGDYTKQTWTGTYDMTYLSGIPVVSDFYFDLRDMNYKPSDHINELIPLWDYKWDPGLGTVPADQVTNLALTYVANTEKVRLVAHYAQPHVPYVGERKILPWDGAEPGNEDLKNMLQKDIDRPTQRIYGRIQSGEISEERLRQAYVDNLHYVLKEVVRLIDRVDYPVIITGDHGEHLGEGGKYLHGEESTLIRQVPWFVVDESEMGQLEIESEYDNNNLEFETSTQSDQDVKDRLADLGYVE